MLAFKLNSFQIDYLFAYLIALESVFDLEPEKIKAAIFSYPQVPAEGFWKKSEFLINPSVISFMKVKLSCKKTLSFR